MGLPILDRELESPVLTAADARIADVFPFPVFIWTGILSTPVVPFAVSAPSGMMGGRLVAAKNDLFFL
jgi:hypothetical protein